MHPILLPLLKIGTTGAGIMAGSTIATMGLSRVAGLADRHLGTGLESIISGPLDVIGTILDPLDLTGMRARKEAAAKSAMKKGKAKMKQQEKARKAAVAEATAAENKATEAEQRASALEAQASAAEARANDAEAREKRNKAVKQRRWAGLAKKTAVQAKAQSTGNPDAALEMAKAAFDLAKFAIAPPKTAQAALADPNLDPAGKSLVADVFDEMNRLGPAPNYDALVQRMWGGIESAANLLPDDDDYDTSGHDDDDVDGPDEYEVDGPVRGKNTELAAANDWADDFESRPVAGPEDVAGPCCSSCAMGSSCGGASKYVPEPFLDGSAVAGDDDDDVGEGLGVLFGDVSGDDEDETSGHDDDWGEVAGPSDVGDFGEEFGFGLGRGK